MPTPRTNDEKVDEAFKALQRYLKGNNIPNSGVTAKEMKGAIKDFLKCQD